MSEVAVVQAAVEKVVQASDPNEVADELAGQIQPLLQSVDAVELEKRHQIGCILNARLKPAGQKRLAYGGKVMERLAEVLDTSRPSLGRMCQFATKYPTLADFQAQHPDVKTWTQARQALVKPKAASQSSPDLTKLHLKQCSRSLATYLERFTKSLNGSHANLVGECQRVAQALMEMFQQHLPTNSKEGDTQLES